jgi:hypothetical protein
MFQNKGQRRMLGPKRKKNKKIEKPTLRSYILCIDHKLYFYGNQIKGKSLRGVKVEGKWM